MVFICPACDCNAIAILCFLFGLLGGVSINVIAEEGRRRKALKDQEREPEPEKDKLDGGGYV
jgi:hypothetical protein